MYLPVPPPVPIPRYLIPEDCTPLLLQSSSYPWSLTNTLTPAPIAAAPATQAGRAPLPASPPLLPTFVFPNVGSKGGSGSGSGNGSGSGSGSGRRHSLIERLNLKKKPYTAVTVQVDRLTSENFEENEVSGIPDLIESIRLQNSGPSEASRAIRKKL